MIKNLTGGALISYGTAFPPESEAYDGALFYKTTGADQGLYIFSFNADANAAVLGDQVAQGWQAVTSSGVYVTRTGDTMSGPLGLTAGGATNDPYGRVSVTFPADTNNYGYYGLTRQGQQAWSLGIDSNNRFFIGTGGAGTSNNVPARLFTIGTDGTLYSGSSKVWSESNDGPGTGLDADTLDGYHASSFLQQGSQLQFTPVQQGGGTGQSGSKVYIGYAGSGLGLQVDSTNYGTTWPINITGSATSAANANYATTAGSATNAISSQYVRARGASGGSNMTFFPDAGSGTPTYVWGTSDGVNAYLYTPGSLPAGTVTNATNAQNAVVAQQLRQNGTANGTPMTFNWQTGSGSPSRIWGSSDGVNHYVYDPASLVVGTAQTANSVAYANVTGTPNLGNYIDRAVDIWKTSTDGTNRFYFGASGRTYFGGSDYEWRNIGGSSIMTLSAGGALVAAGDVTGTSDRRLKKDVVQIVSALDKVEQLVGVLFTRKLDDSRGTGLIAQDVQKVLPEAVHEGEDGMLSVAYGNLVGLLVEAIKELSAEVKELKAKQ